MRAKQCQNKRLPYPGKFSSAPLSLHHPNFKIIIYLSTGLRHYLVVSNGPEIPLRPVLGDDARAHSRRGKSRDCPRVLLLSLIVSRRAAARIDANVVSPVVCVNAASKVSPRFPSRGTIHLQKFLEITSRAKAQWRRRRAGRYGTKERHGESARRGRFERKQWEKQREKDNEGKEDGVRER